MRIMVLQARRTDDPMLKHERECFAAATVLDPAVFDWRNVVEDVPTLDDVRAADALLIGGSGDFEEHRGRVIHRGGVAISKRPP